MPLLPTQRAKKPDWAPNWLWKIIVGSELPTPASMVLPKGKAIYHGSQALSGLFDPTHVSPGKWMPALTHFAKDPRLAETYSGKVGSRIIPAQSLRDLELLDLTQQIPARDADRLVRAAVKEYPRGQLSASIGEKIPNWNALIDTEMYHTLGQKFDIWPEVLERAGYSGVKYIHPPPMRGLESLTAYGLTPNVPLTTPWGVPLTESAVTLARALQMGAK